MSGPFSHLGKQVLCNGEHFADARDAVAASAITVALNDRPLLTEVYHAAHDYLHSVHRTSTWVASQRLSAALKAACPTEPNPELARAS